MPRPTLGGAEWPYPRRLATHVASQGPDGKGIEPNVKQPWLPYDEAFSFTKVCLTLFGFFVFVFFLFCLDHDLATALLLPVVEHAVALRLC